MKGQGAPDTSKSDLIIAAAIRVLRDSGYHGMSMRAVAGEAGVSLSNVQYYYRDKDTLVAALVDHYMGGCERELQQWFADMKGLDLVERRKRLLKQALAHGHGLTEMCLVFREIWALSSRNDTVSASVQRYYASYASLISHGLVAEDAEPETRRRLALLLVPYIEGYSIAGAGLRENADDALALLERVVAML